MVETDALINAIFSFVIPGLGQAIEGYKTRAIILFIIAVIIAGVLFYINVNQIIRHIVYGIYCLIVAYDTYRLY